MNLPPRARAGILVAGAFVGVGVLSLSPVAYSAAAPEGGFPSIWSGIYPGSDSLTNVTAGTSSSCQLCHRNAFGGDSFNGYGWDIKARMTAGATVQDAIVQVESFDSDGNPAATTNLDEITQGYQPGWSLGPHNMIYFGNGSTEIDQLPPAVAGDVDPPLYSTYGCGVNPPGSANVLSGSPTLGTVFELGLDNPLGSQGAPAMSLVAISLAPSPSFPCGDQLAGWGMSGSFGELLISIQNPVPFAVFFGDMWMSAGSPASVPIPIPPDLPLVGRPLFFQGVLTSPNLKSTLTEGMQVTIGY